jgi:hypothetical protein
MEGIPIEQFEEWAKGYGWLEVLTKVDEETSVTSHLYATPSGSLIQVDDGDGEIIDVKVIK